MAQRYKGMGGWEAGKDGGGEGGGKTPQVKTQGHQSPSDGSDHSTRPKGHHSRIPGWLHLIGALHRCQCVGHGFTRL